MTQLDLQQQLEQACNTANKYANAFSESQEKLAQAEAERDALQQQVNALAAENLALLDFDWVSFNEDGPYEPEEVEALLPNVRATDAIMRQWMAEGAHEVAVRITACEDEFPADSLDIVQECAGIADNCAAQLRQSEEKGQ